MIPVADKQPQTIAIDLPKLEEPTRRWPKLLLHVITAALVVAIATSVSLADVEHFAAAVRAQPAFLIVLAALYFALPIADWIIFRRLWRLPVAGFPVLLRKRISNELLIDYSGEAYFYLWARQRASLTNAPFGAIKDVNIQSALAANLVTMLLLLVAYPFLTQLNMGRYASASLWSALLIMGITLGVLVFRRRVYSLDRRQLIEILGIHLARLAVTTTLAAVLWHLLAPAAPIGLWLALAALRLLVTRLPFIPQKEVLFASIAVFMLGRNAETSGLVALTSASLLAMHLIVGAGLVVGAFWPRREVR